MVTVEEYTLRQDSGGAGRFRGGLGTRMRVRLHTPARVNAWIERTVCAPWGLAGGHEGATNAIRIERADGDIVTFDSGKVEVFDLAAGDSHVVELGGGGGFGDPRARPVPQVVADVRAGYVSIEAARALYGVEVAVDADGDVVLDEAATATLRAGATT